MTYSIETQNQLLKATESVTGTPFSLHYQSDRTPSQRRRSVTVPLSGATVPQSLKRIELQIGIAGQSLIESFAPDPDQQYTFTWNGRDAYGREVQGVREAHVRVGYVYQGVYQQPSNTDRSFAQTSGAPIPGSQARQEVTRWREWSVSLGTPWDATDQGLGGWTLDVHHAYDPINRRFFGGDGSWRNAVDIGETVQVVAGTGFPGDAGDGGPATEAEFSALGVDVTDDGTVYVADTFNHRVRRVATDGTVTTVVGTGDQGRRGDGGPAIDARLNFPSDVAVAPDDTLYIADTGSNRVRRVTPDGRIDTVVGLPEPPGNSLIQVEEGTSLEALLRSVVDNLEPFNDVPATTAQLVGPHSVVIGPNGDLYVADAIRVYIVDAAEIITTQTDLLATASSLRDADIGAIVDDVVSGLERTVGDLLGREERRAIRDGLSVVPIDIAVSQAGDLYVLGLEGDYADFEILSDIEQATVVLQVGSDGMIERVAGGGELTGGEGDGGSATETRIVGSAVTTAPDGTLYIGAGDRIYRVDLDGRIFTAAGGNTDLDALVTPAPETDQANPDTREAGLVELLNVFQSGLLATQLPGGALRLVVASDGALYFTPTVASYVLRLASAFPSIATEEIVIVAEDGRELYVFDPDGRHRRTLDALTGADRYAFTYTDAGTLASVTDGDGNVTRIERGGDGTPRAIVSLFGRRTILRLDTDGMLASLSNPAGGAVRFEYDDDSLLTELTDANGAQAMFEYDEDDRVTAHTDLAGRRTDFVREWTETGYEVRVVRPALGESRHHVERRSNGTRVRSDSCCNGRSGTTILLQDGKRTVRPDGVTVKQTVAPDPQFGMQAPAGGVVEIRTPAGLAFKTARTRSFDLDDSGDVETLSSVVTVNGKRSTQTFDAADRTVVARTPVGRTRTAMLNERGRVTRVEEPGSEPIVFGYGESGRLTSISAGSDPNARTLAIEYGTGSKPTAITGPAGYLVQFEYDSVGRLRDRRLPDGAVVQYSYDANGSVIAITPPGRRPHVFSHSSTGQLERYAPPSADGVDIGRVNYDYDAEGRLGGFSLSDGRSIEIDYDENGSPATVTGAAGDIVIEYDPNSGYLSQVTTPDGVTLEQTYDGHLITSAIWSGPVEGSVAWTYDDGFTPIADTVNGGHEVGYTYDGDGRLIRAGDLQITYDTPSGLPSRIQIGETHETWAYDEFGGITSRAVRVDDAVIYKVTCTYDERGRIAKQTETVGGENYTSTYKYDDAGRLEAVDRDGESLARYTYDANGNRTKHATPSKTVAATYDGQDRLLTYGDTEFAHAANGELTTRTEGDSVTEYEYDEFGDLVSVSLPDGDQIAYMTDGHGRRVGKRRNGREVRSWLYGDLLNPIAELDAAGNVVSRFVFGLRPNVPEYLVRVGRVYRYVVDHRGSPRLIVDVDTGRVVQRLEYDPYGAVLEDTNPGFQPFGFAGGLYDPDTGLVRFGDRDYDPSLGRWTARELVRFDGGEAGYNLYTYVDGDPVNFVDLTGQKKKWWRRGLDDLGDAFEWLRDKIGIAQKTQSQCEKVEKAAYTAEKLRVALGDDPAKSTPEEGAESLESLLDWIDIPIWDINPFGTDIVDEIKSRLLPHAKRVGNLHDPTACGYGNINACNQDRLSRRDN